MDYMLAEDNGLRSIGLVYADFVVPLESRFCMLDSNFRRFWVPAAMLRGRDIEGNRDGRWCIQYADSWGKLEVKLPLPKPKCLVQVLDGCSVGWQSTFWKFNINGGAMRGFAMWDPPHQRWDHFKSAVWDAFGKEVWTDGKVTLYIVTGRGFQHGAITTTKSHSVSFQQTKHAHTCSANIQPHVCTPYHMLVDSIIRYWSNR